MKLKKIFPFFIAILALLTSCAEEAAVTLLDEVQVSSSYVSIPVEGGTTPITVTAKDSWTVEKVVTKKDSVKWLTISSSSGNAGESKLAFSASSTLNGRTAEVLIKGGGKTQRINIIQGLSEPEDATCADIIAGPDSKTYRVTGKCTSITNTVYGNWILTDNTGAITIYGTLDKDGKTQNFTSWKLAVGDEITVEGPKLTFGTTVELVNVTVVKINKSLVKVDSVKNEALPLEGGEFIAYLSCIGQGVSVEIPDNAKSWLSISSIQSAGIKTVVKFKAAANTAGDRGTTLAFHTTDGTKDYSAQTSITQKGAIIKATIAEFNAAPVSDTQYRLTGVITSIPDATSGKLYMRDFSGETYVYKITDFSKKGLKVGDIITIVGKRAAYNGTPQVAGAVLESSIPVTTASIADVLTKPDDTNIYFMVTGEITSVKDPVYGNLYLKNGDSEIYLYGCYSGYGAAGDYKKNFLATKGIKVGDKLTVIATKGSYKGVAQLANGIYFSHESAQ